MISLTEIAERKYTASSRNGYTAVDELIRKAGSERFLVLRLVNTFSKKVAESVAGQLNQAYSDGRNDVINEQNRAAKKALAAIGVDESGRS